MAREWLGPKRRGVSAKTAAIADSAKPTAKEVLATAARRRAFDKAGQAGIPAGQRNAFGPAMAAPQPRPVAPMTPPMPSMPQMPAAPPPAAAAPQAPQVADAAAVPGASPLT